MFLYNEDKKRDEVLLKNYGINIVRIPEKILDGKHDLEVKEIILRSIDADIKHTFANKR